MAQPEKLSLWDRENLDVGLEHIVAVICPFFNTILMLDEWWGKMNIGRLERKFVGWLFQIKR